MKFNLFKSILVSILFLLSPVMSFADISKTYSLDSIEFNVSLKNFQWNKQLGFADIQTISTEQSVKKNNIAYSKLGSKSEDFTEKVKAYPLNLLFYIPFDEKVDTIECTFKNSSRIKYYYIKGDRNEQDISIPKEDSEDLVNSGSAKERVEYIYEGRGRFLNVKVFPYTVNMDSVGMKNVVEDTLGTYCVYRDININIKTSKINDGNVKIDLRSKDVDEYVWYIKHSSYLESKVAKIENREDLENDLNVDIQKILENHFSNITVDTAFINSIPKWSVPFYEYVVITSKELAKSFEPLVTWKRRKGLNAGVVSIEDILSDNVESIYSKTEKLKHYLRSSFDSGIGKYVLFGGNSKIIPVARGYNDFQTDLYYSMVGLSDKENEFKNVKKVDSLKITENTGKILYLGRLLCEKREEVDTWMRKQLLYEQNPGNGDFSYLQKMLVTCADNPGSSYYEDTITQQYFVIDSLMESIEIAKDSTPVFPKGSDVIKKMNEHYGIMSNFNHGTPTSYAVATVGENKYKANSKWTVQALDYMDADSISFAAKEEEGNGFDNLTNYNYPSVMYSTHSCSNMPFDYSEKKGLRTLAEAFTVLVDGGGVAYFGHTEDSRGNSLGEKFFEIAGMRYEEEEYLQFGILEHLSKCEGGNAECMTHHNLSGCPETNLWMGIPQKFTDVKITKAGGTLAVTIPADQISNKTDVHITSAEDGGISYQKSARFSKDKTVLTFTDVPEDYVLVITQPRHVPYIFSSVGCYIQNETFASDMSYDCDRIVAGENVTDTKEQGPVVVEKGAKLTLTAKDKTVLKGGFQVKLGGSLEVK